MSRAEELKALVAADNRLSFEEARTSRDVMRGTEQSGETAARVCCRLLNQECISDWIILNRLKNSAAVKRDCCLQDVYFLLSLSCSF